MYRLTNVVKHYDWGSMTAIPTFLGAEADGRPVAEVWMGTHPDGPSRVRGRSLRDVIDDDPTGAVGPRVSARFGDRLPFLFKVLAASRPLSLQVHPNADQAREGFAREEAAGVDRHAPERSFHDDQHKPEMLYALTRFEGLSGFRQPRRVIELLDGISGPLAAQIRDTLVADPTRTGIQRAFELTVCRRGEVSREEIDETARSCEARLDALEDGGPGARAYGTLVALAHWYPTDPGAIASILLNRFSLAPGEAMYVPAGVVHAYLGGLGLEIMASSDNVLRAGITPKHVDVEALLACTVYDDGAPSRPNVVPGAEGKPDVVRPPADEFALAIIRPTASSRVHYATQDGPRIVICTAGAVALRTAGGAEVALTKGETVFVRHDEGRLEVRGEGEAVMAFVP